MDLIISIDKNDNELVYELADKYVWEFGRKIIIKQQKQLGLREHILNCGDLTLNNDAIIMLEDDLIVSKSFYRYAIQSVNFYSSDPNIAGISLYSYRLAETVNRPFIPLQDDSDIYFMKVPSSWGQIWTKEQWLRFRDWYNEKEYSKVDFKDKVPTNVLNWPESSWKKYFYMYLVLNNKYIIYPRIGLSTNMGEVGTHFVEKTNIYQSILMGEFNRNYIFKDLDKSNAIYDAFYENEYLVKYFKMQHLISIDYYGSKKNVETRYLITTKNLDYKIINSWGLALFPYELNIFNEIYGENIFMYDLTQQNKNNMKKAVNNLMVLKYELPGLTKKNALYIALNEYKNTVKQKLIGHFSKS